MNLKASYKMKKILTVALVALSASLAVSTAASAFAFSEELQQKLDALKAGKNGAVASPGDAFNPNPVVVDVRSECAAIGGTAKRVFNGNDFVWTCVA